MNVTPANKEHALLLRVFKLLKTAHYLDHKCVKNYIVPVRIDRQLGGEIGNWVQSHYGKFYHEQRRKAEAYQKEQRQKAGDEITWHVTQL